MITFVATAVAGMLSCADLPPGFQRTVAVRNLTSPVVLDFLPNGWMLIGEKAGAVKLSFGGDTWALFSLSNISSDNEMGLLGMAVDPDFQHSPYIYVYYTTAAAELRVSRFRVTNNYVNPDDEQVLWQNPQLATGPSHHGGCIGFASDGTLFIATGEELEAQYAQDISSQRGKILRINKDGTIPADNPFFTQPGADPRIWAYGFRNPFRFAVDPAGGPLYVGDVGFYSWEEVDRIWPGDNGGWPNMEGPECYTSDCADYTQPLWWYGHCDPVYAPDCQAAVILGPVYRGAQFPTYYQGSLFVADLLEGWMRRLVFTPQGEFDHVELFDAGDRLSTIVDIKVGPEGALYYTCVGLENPGTQTVYRIEYVGGTDHAPIAHADANPTEGIAPPLEVHFDSGRSSDPDADPLSFHWEFGDGETSDDPAPVHVYTAPGLRQVTLTVSDGTLIDTDDLTITVGSPPQVVIINPPEGTRYKAGEWIFVSGDAWDIEQGQLGGDMMSWTVMVVHDQHLHPFLGPVEGVQNLYLHIPTTGHPPENMHYRIELTVHNAHGLSTTVKRDILPVISLLTLDSDPPGAALFLDGNPIQTPKLFQSVVGFEHTLVAPSPALIDGGVYLFGGWEDYPYVTGEFQFTAPEGGQWFTALYTPDCATDFNQDGYVNGEDFDQFVAAFEFGDPAADFDHNTFVNGEDFDQFVAMFEAGC